MFAVNPEDHLGLAYFTAKKMKAQTDMEFEDVLSLCYIGLMRACKRFDPEKGFQFSTYATHYMKGEVLHERDRRRSTQNDVYLEDMLSDVDGGCGKWESVGLFAVNNIDAESEVIESVYLQDKINEVYANSADRNGTRQRIIKCLLQNPEASQMAIAGHIGISQPVVSRAIQDFKKELKRQLAG